MATTRETLPADHLLTVGAPSAPEGPPPGPLGPGPVRPRSSGPGAQRRHGRARRRLSDGTETTLVPAGPGSRRHLTTLLEAMSPRSRQLRFFQAVPVVTPALVDRLCAADHRDHSSWLLHTSCGPIGHVMVVRTSERSLVGDVALMVADSWHGRGAGRILLEAAGVVADEMGITALRCDVRPENRPSAALFRSVGTRFSFEGGDLVGEGPVPDWRGPEPSAGALRISLRRAASAAERGMHPRSTVRCR